MNVLPIKQVGESQWRTSELHIEPEAKVMQGHFGGQARLKAVQGMRPLPRQSKGIEQLIVSGFNDLTQTGQPASPVFGPAPFAPLVRRADDLRIILLSPEAMHLLTGKALIGHIDALRWRTHTGQARGGSVSRGKKGFSQGVDVATGWSKAEAGNHARGSNGGEQMKAF